MCDKQNRCRLKIRFLSLLMTSSSELAKSTGFRTGWMVGQKGGWAETEGDAGGEGEGLGVVDVGRDGREEGFRLLKMEG